MWISRRTTLTLERWFRNPKSHERRIQRHQDTGTSKKPDKDARIGCPLVVTACALPAKKLQPSEGHRSKTKLKPLLKDLYWPKCPPETQKAAIHRQKIIRKKVFHRIVALCRAIAIEAKTVTFPPDPREQAELLVRVGSLRDANGTDRIIRHYSIYQTCGLPHCARPQALVEDGTL